MNNFVFRCPQTGFNVHHRWPDDEKPHDDKVYETVACPGLYANASNQQINRETVGLQGLIFNRLP